MDHGLSIQKISIISHVECTDKPVFSERNIAGFSAGISANG
jgi:hypothetical protein